MTKTRYSRAQLKKQKSTTFWNFFLISEYANVNSEQKRPIDKLAGPLSRSQIVELNQGTIYDYLNTSEHLSLYAIASPLKTVDRFPKDLIYIKGLELNVTIALWVSIIYWSSRDKWDLSVHSRFDNVTSIRIYRDRQGKQTIVMGGLSKRFVDSVVQTILNVLNGAGDGDKYIHVPLKELCNGINRFAVWHKSGYPVPN